MKINDLKVGNWVTRKNVPNEFLKVLVIDSIKNTVYLDLDGRGVMEKIENIEPVEITSEIIKTQANSKLKNNPTIWLCVDGDGNDRANDVYRFTGEKITPQIQIIFLFYFFIIKIFFS